MTSPPPFEKPSKSYLKREMKSLQKLGEELVALSSSELDKIPLDETLLAAIQEAQKITSHEGKRRQLQYIGKLMREEDPEPIEAALKKIKSKHHGQIILFHQTEQWRDQLVENNASLTEFIQSHPQVDHQQLRQLVRNAQQKKSGAEKELFRFIKMIIENK